MLHGTNKCHLASAALLQAVSILHHTAMPRCGCCMGGRALLTSSGHWHYGPQDVHLTLRVAKTNLCKDSASLHNLPKSHTAHQIETILLTGHTSNKTFYFYMASQHVKHKVKQSCTKYKLYRPRYCNLKHIIAVHGNTNRATPTSQIQWPTCWNFTRMIQFY
jgi:hypothetical protein